MIEVDGLKYTADQVEAAIRERDLLKKRVKVLEGPFTCGHNLEYAGGACAACHAIWIDAAEKAEKMADVKKHQFDELLVEAMNRLCRDHKNCGPLMCPAVDLGLWSNRLRALGSFMGFVGKSSTQCPACYGSGEFGLADGEVPCQSCCGSGERNRKGIFYQKKPTGKAK